MTWPGSETARISVRAPVSALNLIENFFPSRVPRNWYVAPLQTFVSTSEKPYFVTMFFAFWQLLEPVLALKTFSMNRFLGFGGVVTSQVISAEAVLSPSASCGSWPAPAPGAEPAGGAASAWVGPCGTV